VNDDDIQVAVTYLSDSVASRLRKNNFKCRVVQVTIKDINLKSITRQTTLTAPTYLSREISDAAVNLITKNWKKGNPIRMLTITGENLIPADQAENENVQLSLFNEPAAPRSERVERLGQTLDLIRKRFGEHAVQPANILGNDLGSYGFNPVHIWQDI
jgi:DNA polymerase-4